MRVRGTIEGCGFRSPAAMNSFDGNSYMCDRTEIVNGKGFIVIHGGDVTHKAEAIGCVNVTVIDIDGCPCTCIKCRPRFIKCLLKSNGVQKLYGLFAGIMPELAIKEFFQELWLAKHNLVAMKQNITEWCENNRARKSGATAPHSYRNPYSGNMSVRSAATRYRAF